MFVDFRTLGEKSRIEADLCIIGAGAAGITLAREFIGSGIQVCLLESGGFGRSPNSGAVRGRKRRAAVL